MKSKNPLLRALAAQNDHLARISTKEVFIVQFWTHQHAETRIGSVFFDEEAAKAEVRRLEGANKHTRARYVQRRAE